MLSTRPLFPAVAGLAAWLFFWPALPASAEPMEQAVEAALSYHPSVDAAKASYEALNQERNEAWSDYLPQLSIDAQGGRIYGDNSTSRGLSVTRGAGYSGYGEGGISLRQPLFDGFETSDRVGAAAARRDSADYNIVDVREKLALRVVLAYLDVLRGRDALARLQEYAGKVDDYISRIGKMVDEGAADASMGQQARDIRAQLENTIVSTEGQVRNANANYFELTGHAPEDPMEKPVPPMDMIPSEAAAAIEYASQNHPSVLSAEMTEMAADEDVSAEKASLFPDFTGELSYRELDQKDLLGGESVDARAVVRMNWNYEVGGAYQARVRKNISRRIESQKQKEDMQRQVSRQVAVAYSDRRTAEEQMKIQDKRVKLNEDLLSTQKAQFEASRINLLQLMQTDNALFNARLALMNDEYRLLAAQYAILASAGRLQDTVARPVKTAVTKSHDQ